MKKLNEMIHIKYLALCPIHMLSKYQLLSLHYVTMCLAKVFKIKLPSDLLKGHFTFQFHSWQAVLVACIPRVR